MREKCEWEIMTEVITAKKWIETGNTDDMIYKEQLQVNDQNKSNNSEKKKHMYGAQETD